MEIIKPKLKWNGRLKSLKIEDIKHIILHHTAHLTWNFYDVHSYHRDVKSWLGIGYNFFIEKDGKIYEGRGFNVGAGATNYNYNSLHICFAGNFEKEKPTAEQIKSGKWLVSHLLNLCNKNVDVLGHKDVGNTACPGKYFPLQDFKKGDENMKEKRYQTLEEIPEWGKSTVEKLVNLEILKGNENGLDLSEDMLRILVMHDRLKLYD